MVMIQKYLIYFKFSQMKIFSCFQFSYSSWLYIFLKYKTKLKKTLRGIVFSTFNEMPERVRGQVCERVRGLRVQRRQRQHLVAAALLLRHRLGPHAPHALAPPQPQRRRLRTHTHTHIVYCHPFHSVFYYIRWRARGHLNLPN